MKAKRVDCGECNYFVFDRLKGNRYWCKLGKRTMFRMSIGDNWTNAGWIRYCDEFKQIEK